MRVADNGAFVWRRDEQVAVEVLGQLLEQRVGEAVVGKAADELARRAEVDTGRRLIEACLPLGVTVSQFAEGSAR